MKEILNSYEKYSGTDTHLRYQLQGREGEIFSEKRKIADFYLPEKFSSFFVIIPGAGFNEKKNFLIYRHFRYLLGHGIALLIFNLDNFSSSRTDEEFFQYIAEKVAEIRKTINFIYETFQVKNVSIGGISFGGILSFLTGGMEEGIRKFVIMISGVDIEKITWRSLLRFRLKKDCSRKVCHRMHVIYKKLIKENFFPEICNLPRKCFIYDPLVFLEHLKDRNIIMVNGMFDLIIPFYCALPVKRKIKKTKIFWYPGTHITFFVFLPFFKNRILKFLKD
jgi:hypothetical protein